jgi:hypothetical protein
MPDTIPARTWTLSYEAHHLYDALVARAASDQRAYHLAGKAYRRYLRRAQQRTLARLAA